jgi:BirA family biotin operon repressor/biotin-[acetyl-CoA-carboxylase] ligase
VSWLGAERVTLESCGSTNDVALVHAKAGAAHGTIVTADTQTAGRGRLGRTWASPPDANLYLSIIVRSPRSLAELAPLTLAIGIGVVDAVRAEGVDGALKWPNDVFAGGRKLAGVLCEVAGDGCVVAGIGVNVNDVPPEVAATATSIADERSGRIDRAAFTERLLLALEPWIMADTDELVTDDDGWTLRSATGCLTAHSEHTIAITEDGAEILTLPR